MFTEELWQGWVGQESANYDRKDNKRIYKKKSYLHFDHRFWFPDHQERLREILESRLKIYQPSTKRFEFWSFSPFLKILLKTPRFKYQEEEECYDLQTKIRPIAFASHLDSLILSFYSYCLTRQYEAYIQARSFHPCVLAYRADLGKSNIQFAKEVFDVVKDKGTCTAIALDIKGYFDHIDHAVLKTKWLKVLGLDKLPEDQFRIFNVLTQYSYVGKASFYKKFRPKKGRKERDPGRLLDLVPGENDAEKYRLLRKLRLVVSNNRPDKKTKRFRGVPQGAPMSAVLSNIYLIDYDEIMEHRSQVEGFIYRRYCDDILIICDTAKAKEIKDTAIDLIKKDHYLTIQPSKVEVIDFRQNLRGELRAFRRGKNDAVIQCTNTVHEKRCYKSLQYLGFEYNGQDIFIRSSSLSAYFRKMKARIIKSISMAYGAGENSEKVFKQKILKKYSHLGRQNFISYAYRAASAEYKNKTGHIRLGMNSIAIRKQISRHFSILLNSFKIKNKQRIAFKASRKKSFSVKNI